MTAERWEKIKEIFDSALAFDQPAERSSFLDTACSGDGGLRLEVDRLLVEFERADDFLEQPLARPTQALSKGELVGGRYRVGDLLGRGGMGEVYRVHDQLLGEEVALKTLRLGLSGNERALAHFQREIQLARKITHPNVCRIFEVGEQEFASPGSPKVLYFTMQLLEGETLAARIRRAGPMGSQEAFPLIVQMAGGLQAAHAVGILHRDFKSGNVMLSGGRAVITDFGLARMDAGQAAAAPSTAAPSTAAASTAGGLVGTVAYMSPEQLTAGTLTPASDLYAFGIVMFEMATGRLPFEGRNLVHSAVQRATGKGTGVRRLVGGIDPRWETAIEGCLQAEPAARWRSAAEIAELFRGSGAPWRPARWTRRQWASAGALATIPVAAGGAYWYLTSQPYEPRPEALAWYEKGLAALHGLTYEAARKALEKAVEIDPAFALAYAQLARAYSELDYGDRAKGTMLRALTVAEAHPPDVTSRMWIKAIQHTLNWDLQRAAPIYRDLERRASARDKPAYLVEIGWLAWKRRDIPLATESFAAALRRDPSHAGAALRLAFMEARAGQYDRAFEHFTQAEANFRAASALDGVTQALLERAVVLSRLNRDEEAIPLIERAKAGARATGDLYHLIRLQLALALTRLRQGKANEARRLAEEAIRTAFDNKMENTATIGLLDLGNAHVLKGELAEAEKRFRQGLEIARRNAGEVNEARALLSLGSLAVQTNRPAEALEFIRRALEYYRRANFQQEIAQSLILTGGAHEDLAQFEESERVLREAVRATGELRDADQSTVARLFLSRVLERRGNYPGALAVAREAVAGAGNSRGGMRAASGSLRVAHLSWMLGDFAGAREALEAARKWLRARTAARGSLAGRAELCAAELAYEEGRWAAVGEHARSAAGVADEGDGRAAAFLRAAARIRAGHAPAAAECLRLIEQSGRAGSKTEPPEMRLLLAEALPRGDARAAAAAREALAFFEPHAVWERVWRCRHAIDPADPLARQAFERLRSAWPPAMFASYCKRPSIQKKIASWL